MAKKQASPERYAELNGGRAATFVNYEMSTDEKKEYKSWLSSQSAESLVGLVEKLLDDKYNLSVKYDEYNQCFGAFITGQPGQEHNKALILAGRGRTPSSAMLNVLYRHYNLFSAEWPYDESHRHATDDD